MRSQRGGQLRELFGQQWFVTLLAARLFSQCADGIFQASLYGALLFNPEHHTEPAEVAGGLVLLVLPYSVVGPFAGVFLDRWRRQRVLSRGATIHGVLAAGSAVLLATLGSRSPIFDIAAFGALAVNRFYLAAQSAALPSVVAERHLVIGNALSTTAGTVVTIVGGGIGLGVRHLSGSNDDGTAVVAAVSFVGYLVAAAAAARLPADRLGPHEPAVGAVKDQLSAIASGFASGAAYVWRHRPAARALGVRFGHQGLFGLWTIMTLLLYRNTFHNEGPLRAGLVGAGQAATAGGVGLVVAALITPRMTRRIGLHRWIALSTALPALSLLALGTPYRLPLFVLSAVALGFAMHATKVCVDTIVQETVEDDFRGRAFALYDAGSNACFAAMAVVGAFMLPLSGRSPAALIVMSTAYLLLSGAYAATSRTDPRPDPATNPSLVAEQASQEVSEQTP
ncbi:MAG TPA: MFS transporter [Mycobacteriales bacterium]|nr:MFS transporter [Mycobacteriales bacterium]